MTNHAVIVGYSGYEHFKPLDGVISTADCFRSMLSYRVDGSGVFDSVDQIIDEEPGQVNDKLSDIFAKVQKQDRVALILIGHGMVWGGDPSLRLASHLAKPEAENEAHWLTVSSIANKLEASTDADRLLILDCCGAGFYDLEGSEVESGFTQDPPVSSMDAGLDQDALANQALSPRVRASLGGKVGEVATIVSTASDSAAWLGRVDELTHVTV